MVKASRDSQLNLLWTSRMDFTKDQWVRPHCHQTYYQLFLFLSGEGTISYDHREIILQEGYYYLINKKQVHSFRIAKNSMTLDFKFKLHDPLLENLIDKQLFFGACSSSELLQFKQCFKLALTNMNHPASILPYMADANLNTALLSLIYRGDIFHKEKITSMESLGLLEFPPARYLHEHYPDPVTVDEMSRLFGYHPNYLTRLFKDKTGMTPIAYLQAIRLEKACEALEFTSMSIEQTAEKVGLTMQYFSKLFRERKGMTPMQYRKYVRNAINVDVILEEDFHH